MTKRDYEIDNHHYYYLREGIQKKKEEIGVLSVVTVEISTAEHRQFIERYILDVLRARWSKKKEFALNFASSSS